MAISFVRSNFNGSASSGVSTALTTGYTAGDTAFVIIGSPNSSAVSAVSDDAGGSYTQLVAVNYGGGLLAVWAAQGIGSATHITVTQAGSFELTVLEYSGITKTVDKSATNSGTGPAASTGTTAATTQAVELVLAVFAGFGTSIVAPTTPTGYTSRGTTTSVANSALGTFELVTAATGAQSASSSITNASNFAGGIVTLQQPVASNSGRVPNVPTLTTLPTVGSL